MPNRQTPNPVSISHIDELFSQAGLQAFLDAKLSQLLDTDSEPSVIDRGANPLAHCLLDNEAELLDFLRQRLAHLKRQTWAAH